MILITRKSIDEETMELDDMISLFKKEWTKELTIDQINSRLSLIVKTK